MITTVIFDMDGTLIDTEKYYRIFWPIALKEFGYVMTDEQALSMRSLGRPFAPARLKGWFGEELDYSKVRSRRKELMEAHLDRVGIELKPGVTEILAFLKQRGIKTAVATATDLERCTKYLIGLGLYHSFDRVISAGLVEKGKPSPDIYLYACRELSEKPCDCLAVEDSPNGVMSAYRAGCPVVMIPDQTPPDEELAGKLYGVFDRIDGLKTLF